MKFHPLVTTVLGLNLLLTSGCASLLDYRRSEVDVTVEKGPSPVTIEVDGVTNNERLRLVAPTQTAFLSRDSDYRIRFTSPGYQTQAVTVGRKVHPYFWLDTAFFLPAIALAGMYLAAPNNGTWLVPAGVTFAASAISVPVGIISLTVDALTGNMWTHAQNNVVVRLQQAP